MRLSNTKALRLCNNKLV